MRCNDCNKFVSYEEPEVEEQSCEVDGSEVIAEVNEVLPCAECGTELKSYCFEMTENIDHECDKAVYKEFSKDLGDDEVIPWEDEPEYELFSADDWSATDRYQDKDKHGKTIKSARYMKHYYGVEGTVTVKCLKCGAEVAVELKEEAQASEFEEC